MVRRNTQQCGNSSQGELRSQSSQQNPTQGTQLSQITQGNLNVLVNECVTKLLAENFSMKPIKRTNLLRNAKVKGKAAKDLVNEIKNTLSRVYGIALIEHDDKIILINPKNEVLNQYSAAESSLSNEVFLLIILTLIVHNEDEISMDELKLFFEGLSVSLETNNLYFGNVKKLFLEFEQQMYLEKIVKKIPMQPSQIFYKWGIRSNHEVNKKELLPIIAMMYKMAPENLPSPVKRLFCDE